jgi:hypothetical protein
MSAGSNVARRGEVILKCVSTKLPPTPGSILEGCRVDASITLQEDGQGFLNGANLLRRAFHFDEDVLLVSAATRSARAAN